MKIKVSAIQIYEPRDDCTKFNLFKTRYIQSQSDLCKFRRKAYDKTLEELVDDESPDGLGEEDISVYIVIDSIKTGSESDSESDSDTNLVSDSESDSE
jgi:hypothetical protein